MNKETSKTHSIKHHLMKGINVQYKVINSSLKKQIALIQNVKSKMYSVVSSFNTFNNERIEWDETLLYTDNFEKAKAFYYNTYHEFKNQHIIYEVKVVDIKEKSKKDVETDLKIFKLKYPNRKETTLEEYMNFIKDIYGHDIKLKYDISYETVGYFLDEVLAEESVINDCAGISEGGCYPYAVIDAIIADRMYPECGAYPYNFQKPHVYRYNLKTRKYERVSEDGEEEKDNEKIIDIISKSFRVMEL